MITAKRIDATSGPLVRQILLYSLPLILSTVLQNLFNAVDTAVLGNMADSTAVASVGATGTVVGLIVNAFIGFPAGTRIVLARFIGEKNPERIRAAVDTSVILAIVVGLIVAVLGCIFSPLLLQMLNCPEDCFDGAALYLRVYFTAAPAILLYNFCSGIISTAGNTQSPLYYMIAGGILNVVLNILLCLILPNKVAAVAISTVASQILGALLCLRRLRRGEGEIQLKLRAMRWNGPAFRKIFSMGLPLSIANLMYPLGSLQIQSSVNSFGSAAIAGNHASAIWETFGSAFVGGIGTAGGVFIGQNLGAQKHDRVKKSIFHSLWINTSFGAGVGLLLLLTAPLGLQIFLAGDQTALEFGMIRSYCILTAFGIAGVNNALGAYLQNFGYSSLSSINAVVWVLGFRFVWMTWIYPLNPNFFMLMICFAVSWALTMMTNIVMGSIVYIRYRKGKYRRL